MSLEDGGGLSLCPASDLLRGQGHLTGSDQSRLLPQTLRCSVVPAGIHDVAHDAESPCAASKRHAGLSYPRIPSIWMHEGDPPSSVMSRRIVRLPVGIEVLDDEFLDDSLLSVCRAVHGKVGPSHAPLHAAT